MAAARPRSPPFVSVKDADKDNIVPAAEKLIELGFAIIATAGTAAHLAGHGLAGEPRSTRSPRAGRTSSTASLDGDVAIGVRHHRGLADREDSHSIRATALDSKVPYFTTAAASLAAARAIEAVRGHALEVASLQSYYSASKN